MRVLIQGAGIAGLTLARELLSRGIEFRIIEKAGELRPAGAGITLGANALGCLSRTLDLEKLQKRGQILDELVITDHHGGAVMSTPSRVEGIPHSGFAFHRHSLHECLLEGIPSRSISLGTQVRSLTQDASGVQVTLTDGREERFDFLVGADGIHSEIRKRLFPEVQPTFSGYTCWRATLRKSLANPGRAVEMWGPGRRLGLVPIGEGMTYVYATLNIPYEAYRQGLTNLSADEVCEKFADFGGNGPTILAVMRDAGQLIHNDLEEIILSRWHIGRVVLIGDAAHAMTPNLGQGAAMGIEDSVALARIWESDRTPKSLLAYEAIRRPRVKRIQDKSREMGRIAQIETPLFIWLRNRSLRLLPQALLNRQLRQVLRN